MLYWIKRASRLLGAAIFFMVLISLLSRPGALDYPAIVFCFAVAFTAGVVCWFFGTVVCDIMFKGLLVDIGRVSPEELVEGGIVQRLHMKNEEFIPGGAEIPFVNEVPQKNAEPDKKAH
jgi:hypothetical protein